MNLTSSFHSYKEILKYSQILSLGSYREDSPCQRFFLILFCFYPSFCIRSSLSDIKGNLSQLQGCESCLSNSSLNNNFLQSNLALAGEILSTLDSTESSRIRVIYLVLSKSSLLSPSKIIHEGPNHLDLAPALSLNKTK